MRTNLMEIFEKLSEYEQEVVKEMSEAAWAVLREHGFRPVGDDRAAIFDEACARFFVQCRDEALRRQLVGRHG